MDRLKRAIERAMIVASSDTQVALERYWSHGVFTYALVDGHGGDPQSSASGAENPSARAHRFICLSYE